MFSPRGSADNVGMPPLPRSPDRQGGTHDVRGPTHPAGRCHRLNPSGDHRPGSPAGRQGTRQQRGRDRRRCKRGRDEPRGMSGVGYRRGVARSRLLLAPLLTELEWLIKPQLEEWADVASFDAPGVGGEPPAERFGRDAIATRGLVELDRQGWSSYVLVTDTGIAAALRIARARPKAVEAIAFGHARLSDAMDGERPPVNREVHEALGQLLHVDYGNFVRH